jgi:hypothetical protein
MMFLNYRKQYEIKHIHTFKVSGTNFIHLLASKFWLSSKLVLHLTKFK